jgi:Lipid-droplet associated hydrolase
MGLNNNFAGLRPHDRKDPVALALIFSHSEKQLLYFIPQLALIASMVAKFLTLLLPDAILCWLIQLVMGFPPQGAAEATLAFLKSRNGVRQALYVFVKL